MDTFEITLVVGDWSGDGHDRTESFIFACNRPHKSVLGAYSIGKHIVGIDITKECDEYEDNEIRGEVWEKLTKAGYSMQDPEDEGFSPGQFADVWMFIANRGDPHLSYKLVEGSAEYIGGYGLFYP